MSPSIEKDQLNMPHNKRNTRIWVISRLYQPNFSGAAIQAHQILRRLVRQGFSVTVLTGSDRAAAHLRGQRTDLDGVEVRYLATFQQIEWLAVADASRLTKLIAYLQVLLSNLSFALLTARLLWLAGKKCDIVSIYSINQFSVIPIWAARLEEMKTVIHMTLLGSDDPGSLSQQAGLLGRLYLGAFDKANAIVGYSSAQIKSCLSIGIDPNKAFRIPAGVDLYKFHPISAEERIKLRQKLGLKVDKRFIVFVGAAIARKGLGVLVEAFLRIHAQRSDVELLVVGPCDFNDPIYKLGRKLNGELEASGHSSCVHWIGRVENVSDYIQAADIFCLPSQREGFGIVIVESMAAGLPVVVSRIEGVTTDIIASEQEGMLVAAGDSEAYACRFLQLLDDTDLSRAIGRTARARVESEFDLEHVTQQHAELYRRLCHPDAQM
jgi:glycosyltransferase involved in cell wall biosynthesis